MVSEDIAKQLHDKSTRGYPLSSEEQSDLDEWYAEQDKSESRILAASIDNRGNGSVAIQKQIDVALNQLMTVTSRIQEIASENKELKHEITLLRSRLAHQQPSKVKVAA